MIKKPFKNDGFTLIELMLVVAIIGLLAAIAIPKFANLVIKAKEAAIKGKLGSLRSAVSLYYANNEGIYPNATGVPQALTTGPLYLQEIPSIEIPTFPDVHPNFNGVYPFGPWDANWNSGATYGAWAFDAPNGRLTVNCTHTDSMGTTWSLW